MIVKDGVTVAVGSGQQERVGAVEQAGIKGYQKAFDRETKIFDVLAQGVLQQRHLLNLDPFRGAVLSSDAFFPNRDNIDQAYRLGITAVIQPGGSISDHEVIQAVNQHGMAMAYTLERCFGHF